MNLGHGHINGDCLFAGLHLLLVCTVAELALDLDVSVFRKCRGKLSELAPNDYAVPVSPAVVRAGIVLPAHLRGERKRSQLSTVFKLARFRIGTDEPDKIDVILERMGNIGLRRTFRPLFDASG